MTAEPTPTPEPPHDSRECAICRHGGLGRWLENLLRTGSDPVLRQQALALLAERPDLARR